jgi:serine/threonine-protein kinase
VNSVIGYRVRQVVTVRPGSVSTVAVTVPNGTLNINAMPWATVWIDGTSYGETPLGNLSVVPGQHEIVFRHPQLGERREITVVRADTTTKVAITFK